MNRFMPAQAFQREPGNRSDNGGEVFSQLIFHDSVKDGMCLEIRELGMTARMMLFYKLDSLLFVERKPFRWIRRMAGIVTIHGAVS